jgi:isopenicillin N synthase-like dioxygenase
MKYRLPKGVSLFGYKAAGTIKNTDPSLRPDSTEFFNISKDHIHDIVPTRPYPPTITAHRFLLKAFIKNGHECGMLVLRTLERQLGLTPNELVNLHKFEKPAGDHCRLTRKLPYSADANAIGLPSHTNAGSVTVLFHWLGGLQVQSRSPGREGEWEFVRPVAEHAVINLGMDASSLRTFSEDVLS